MNDRGSIWSIEIPGHGEISPGHENSQSLADCLQNLKSLSNTKLQLLKISDENNSTINALAFLSFINREGCNLSFIASISLNSKYYNLFVFTIDNNIQSICNTSFS